MEATARVCPFCGEPPGTGVFCAACGRNLAGVERLPTRAEWEEAGAAAAGGVESAAPDPGTGEAAPPPPPPAADGALADRCAEATAAFLSAMRAAGCPGTATWPMPDAPKEGFFRRTPTLRGWVVRPVVWDDEEMPRHHEPGLVLDTDGAFHVLDSQIRGWGQRDFPVFHDTARAEPVPMPVEEHLIAALDALRAEHGVV
jgi:hypothetical protein